MKREELLIFYSFWLRCFVDMLQYVGFLGRSQLFGSQVKVGAPTWHLARTNCIVGAPTAKLARQLSAPLLSWRAPTPVLARGWGEVIRSDNLDWGLYNKKFSVWESSWTKQRGYIENKGVFVQAEQGM